MSFLKRAREVTGDIASASKRQAQRGKLEIEVRRIESKVSAEKDAIGHALYPLLDAGTLTIDLPDVATHMAAIESLLKELHERQADIEALKQPETADAAGRAESMSNTDQNATTQAWDAQTASDAAASSAQSPAEEGGQG
jgi:hypothetical protein